MAYQPLLVISCQIIFYINIRYMICKHIFSYTQLNDQTVLFLTIQFRKIQKGYVVASIAMYL